MGRPVVIAEEKLLAYLLNLSKREGIVPGLIIGQCTKTEKDYVVHLARSPIPDSEKLADNGDSLKPSGDNVMINKTKPNQVKDIEESWLTSHAKTVTKMLPGGLWILGVFIVCPNDIFGDNVSMNKVSSLISHVGNCVKSNTYMNGFNPKHMLLILHFNSVSKKYSCKVCDIETLNMSVRPIDWKFQQNATDWLKVECCYNMEKVAPLYITSENAKNSLKKNLKELLVRVNENVQKAVCTVGGRFRGNEDILENIKKQLESVKKDTEEDETLKSSKSGDDSIKVTLFVLQEPKKHNEKINVQFVDSVCDIEIKGSLSSQVYLHQKATVEEVVKAVKDDIVRSWAARLEMHWDTYEEDVSKKAELHSLPRRVTYPLPCVPVEISEYIFPDEEPAEALLWIHEQLGFEGDLISLNSSFEKNYDPKVHQETGQDSSDRPSNVKQSKSFNIMIVGIAIAAFVLLLSLIIQFISK